MVVRKEDTGKKEKAAGEDRAVIKTKDTTDWSTLFQGEKTFQGRSCHPKIYELEETMNFRLLKDAVTPEKLRTTATQFLSIHELNVCYSITSQ